MIRCRGSTKGTARQGLALSGVMDFGFPEAQIRAMVSIDAGPLVDALSSRYRFEREIGAGGMARVYLAEDLKHHRRVAVKVLRQEVATGIGAERFVKEIEIVSRLRHPHILPLYDSGEAGGVLYYVMPFVAGESLRARLSREPELPVDEAVRLTREIADALAYAHSQGVIHRDIKPENVLLESGHAVVADFGIARAIAAATADDAVNRLTSTGMALGTPVYMSPEQSAGDRDVDGRSDVYSLGCVLYEMLCGQPPFTGASAAVVARQHLLDEAPVVTARRPRVPVVVSKAVSRALAKNPADRFDTASAFAEQLASPSVSIATAPDVRIGRRIAVGAAVLLLLGAAVWLARGRLPRARASEGEQKHVVAILPLQNLSADSAQSYFAGGISEEIMTELSRLSALRVLSRSAVAPLAAAPDRLKRLASDFGVQSVVEGSVRVHGDSALIITTLTDARSGAALVTLRKNRALRDALSVQSEVARSIADALQTRLTPEELRRLGRAPTVNLDAYELYYRAARLSSTDPQQSREAMTLLRRAIALDPGFARAHVILARRYLFLTYGRGRIYLDSGLAEARAAIAADPDLPQAYFALGDLQGEGGQLQVARTSFLKALELNPSYDAAMQDLSVVEDMAGRHDEALHWAVRAFALSPNSPSSYYHVEGPLMRIGTDSANDRYFTAALARFPNDVRLGLTMARLDILRGRDSAAVARTRQVLGRNPSNQEAQYFMAELATVTDQPDAITFLEPLVRDAPEGRGDFLPESYRTQLGRQLTKRSDRARADSLWTASAAVARQQLAAGNENPALSMELAAISAIRGDTAAAFDALEQSYKMGWRDPQISSIDPFFASLRRMPRFQNLIGRMRADVETMRRAAAAANPQVISSGR